jgi:dihydropyrimidinase
MIDLVIRGDTVVTPQGVGAHDILIADGVIAAAVSQCPKASG